MALPAAVAPSTKSLIILHRLDRKDGETDSLVQIPIYHTKDSTKLFSAIAKRSSQMAVDFEGVLDAPLETYMLPESEAINCEGPWQAVYNIFCVYEDGEEAQEEQEEEQ